LVGRGGAGENIRVVQLGEHQQRIHAPASANCRRREIRIRLRLPSLLHRAFVRSSKRAANRVQVVRVKRGQLAAV
jgi:hypothetical protein